MLLVRKTHKGIACKLPDLEKCLKVENLQKVLKKMEITHTAKFNNIASTTTLKYYYIQKDTEGITWVFFARFSGFLKLLVTNSISHKILHCIKPGLPMHPELLYPGIKLTENQKVVYNHLTTNNFSPSSVAANNSCALIVMDTGTGKTYLSGKIIGFVGRKTLIIIPKKSAYDEWTNMLKIAYPELKVGEYTSKRKVYKNADVMITTFQSANMDIWEFSKDEVYKTSEFFKIFGLVIIDEVHNSPTETRSNMFWKLNNKYVVGITATPDENSKGMDSIYYRHLGYPIIAKNLDGYILDDIKWNVTVEALMYYAPGDYCRRIEGVQGFLCVGKMLEQFISDPWRLSLLLNKVHQEYLTGGNIYIFAEQRDFLIKFSEMLKEVLGVPFDFPEIGVMMGGVEADEKKRQSDTARIILITYGYGAESLSIVRMDTLFLLTPRKAKMTQTIGRILRRGGDPSIPRRIFDVVDANTTIKNQFNVRAGIYAQKDFTVNQVNYNWRGIKLYKIFRETALKTVDLTDDDFI